MSSDARWTVGTGVVLLATILAVFSVLSTRIDSLESRLDARLLSIEEHLRASPAPALPDAPHQ